MRALSIPVWCRCSLTVQFVAQLPSLAPSLCVESLSQQCKLNESDNLIQEAEITSLLSEPLEPCLCSSSGTQRRSKTQDRSEESMRGSQKKRPDFIRSWSSSGDKNSRTEGLFGGLTQRSSTMEVKRRAAEEEEL